MISEYNKYRKDGVDYPRDCHVSCFPLILYKAIKNLRGEL